jgi:hypothetical protein
MIRYIVIKLFRVATTISTLVSVVWLTILVYRFCCSTFNHTTQPIESNNGTKIPPAVINEINTPASIENNSTNPLCSSREFIPDLLNHQQISNLGDLSKDFKKIYKIRPSICNGTHLLVYCYIPSESIISLVRINIEKLILLSRQYSESKESLHGYICLSQFGILENAIYMYQGDYSSFRCTLESQYKHCATENTLRAHSKNVDQDGFLYQEYESSDNIDSTIEDIESNCTIKLSDNYLRTQGEYTESIWITPVTIKNNTVFNYRANISHDMNDVKDNISSFEKIIGPVYKISYRKSCTIRRLSIDIDEVDRFHIHRVNSNIGQPLTIYNNYCNIFNNAVISLFYIRE